ncbi:MAG: helix-turn-helix domain-containing protein [Planctomycetota bacterium]|nr:helix-turn-helix domain-containing protein [Planctomycetota bacterium]
MAVSDAVLKPYLRHEASRQAPVPLKEAGVVNVGFTLKPTAEGYYVNRIRPHFLFLYVLRGEGTFTDWNGQSFPVRAGHLIQMPEGIPHSIVHRGDGRWAECYCAVNPRFHAVLCELGAVDPAARLLFPGLDHGLLLRFDEILDLLRRREPVAHRLALVRAHELLVEAHRLDARRQGPRGGGGEALESARIRLGSNLDQPLDVRAIAREMNLSYERFRKLFRERVGLAPHQYRIQRRIEHAEVLLVEEGRSIKEAAYALGYPDPFAFAKQFKQVTGESPGAFRKRVAPHGQRK